MKNNLILLLLFSSLILSHFIFIKINRWHMPREFDHKNVLIQGVIDTVPENKYHGLRFQFHALTFNHQTISTLFLITWYGHPPKLQVGQQWQFTVRLKPSQDAPHFKHFNYARYLLAHGITATGYVVGRHHQLLSEKKAYFLSVFRQKIENQISHAIHDPTLTAFVSALCVGLRDGLTPNDWQVFQKTGTNHLVAIAGLHIGFVTGAFYFLTQCLMRLFPRLLLISPASTIAKIAALIVGSIYAALSGFAIPAQRALIMLFCFMISNFFCRHLSVTRRWFFAIGIILILNPYDLIDASFWLSFISIAILAWVMSSRLRASSHLVSWGKMQGAIIIGLLPLMLWFFQQMSLIAFFTNAIAIPWVGFIILPMSLVATGLFFCGCYLLSHDLFWLTGKALWPLWRILTFSAKLPLASWHHVISNPLVLIISMTGCIYLLAPKGFPAKWLGCLGFLLLFLK